MSLVVGAARLGAYFLGQHVNPRNPEDGVEYFNADMAMLFARIGLMEAEETSSQKTSSQKTSSQDSELVMTTQTIPRFIEGFASSQTGLMKDEEGHVRTV